jgi:hypothetical protein
MSRASQGAFSSHEHARLNANPGPPQLHMERWESPTGEDFLCVETCLVFLNDSILIKMLMRDTNKLDSILHA